MSCVCVCVCVVCCVYLGGGGGRGKRGRCSRIIEKKWWKTESREEREGKEWGQIEGEEIER